MKKILLVTAVLLGVASTSHAGINLSIGIGLPFPPHIVIRPAAPVVVVEPPVCAPVAPVCQPVAPVVVVRPPVVYAPAPVYYAPSYRHGYYAPRDYGHYNPRGNSHSHGYRR
jgi:hypothetical protein